MDHAMCPHCGYDLRRAESVSVGAACYGVLDGFTFDQRPISLTPSERILVESLLRANGRWVTRESLLGRTDCADDFCLSSIVKRIRLKFDRAGTPRELIRTAYGLGYRWNAAAALREAA